MSAPSIFNSKFVEPFGVTKTLFPQPPKPAKPPDPLDPDEDRRKARLAANRKKTLAAGAFGSSDTIKTGAQGVVTPQAFKGSKSLIGT